MRPIQTIVFVRKPLIFSTAFMSTTLIITAQYSKEKMTWTLWHYESCRFGKPKEGTVRSIPAEKMSHHYATCIQLLVQKHAPTIKCHQHVASHNADDGATGEDLCALFLRFAFISTHFHFHVRRNLAMMSPTYTYCHYHTIYCNQQASATFTSRHGYSPRPFFAR